MRLAAYQFATCGNLDNNFEIIKKAIGQAAENKVDLKKLGEGSVEI